jgi:2-amino-4-hydroxy-6-hydroxymethyldihydropteridine diphosphokinase
VTRVSPSTVFVGLGSNLEHPRQQIRNAMRALDRIPRTRVVADSGLYLSKPLVPPSGPITQPDYYNAVAKMETWLTPDQLLAQLHMIEQAQRRKREQRWGPRTIDLDILLFDDLEMDSASLTVPHPGLHQREFVLYPLSNIDDSLEIPGRGMLRQLIQRCPRNGLQYLGTIEGYR